jgi:hypothetical protein
MQAIDNEDVLVDGKRTSLKKAEILFQGLFSAAIIGNFEAASIIMKSAEGYFQPEAEGPSQAVFVVVPDGCSSPPRLSGKQRKKDLLPVSVGSLFRRVARRPFELNGVRMTMWEACVRQVYEMANENKRAARLLQQFRKAFPVEAPRGKTQVFISEDDARL